MHPGRLDAGAAVMASKKVAKDGVLPVALVDADHYFIELNPSPGKGIAGKTTLRNVGNKGGPYDITWDNPEITVAPTRIYLAEKGSPNDRVEITVTSTN